MPKKRTKKEQAAHVESLIRAGALRQVQIRDTTVTYAPGTDLFIAEVGRGERGRYRVVTSTIDPEKAMLYYYGLSIKPQGRGYRRRRLRMNHTHILKEPIPQE